MKLLPLIIEMNLKDALRVFGLDGTDLGDDSKIKKTYRRLSIQNHPDRGGDEKTMKDINVAYQVLKKASKNGSSSGSGVNWDATKVDWDAIQKKQEEAFNSINAQVKHKFKPELFKRYFEATYNQPFEADVVFPKWEKRKAYYSIDSEFYNKDRTIVFIARFSISIASARNAQKSLGSSMDDISYEVMVTTWGVYKNKKVKFGQRTWKHTNDHQIFYKPDLVFPQKTLTSFQKKVSKLKFTRKDMDAVLKTKLKADTTSDGWKLDFDNNYVLFISRMTFRRTPFYNVELYRRQGKYKLEQVKGIPYKSLPETEETLDTFIKVHKEISKVSEGDDVKAVSIINKYLK